MGVLNWLQKGGTGRTFIVESASPIEHCVANQLFGTPSNSFTHRHNGERAIKVSNSTNHLTETGEPLQNNILALFQACLLMCFCVVIKTVVTSNSETATNSKIKPNIFTPKLILRPEYGLLYEHIGQLYQGLQKYYLVIRIALPAEKDIPDAFTDYH